jgi:hypothetical protein
MAQERLLSANTEFLHVLAASPPKEGGRRGPYRLLIPETLRHLDATIFEDLTDSWLNQFAQPECRSRAASTSDNPGLEALIGRVLLDPHHVGARMDLGAAFERRGHLDCALEQFWTAGDLADDYAYAPLRAARLSIRLGRQKDFESFARLALRRDPTSREARRYISQV